MVHTVHHAVCTGVCHQPVMHNGYLRLAVFHPQPSFGWLLDLFIVDHFAAKHGAEQNFDIQCNGPVFDVPDIITDTLRNISVTAQAVDLRPAVRPGRTCWRTR